jgi:RimJ/RimL family protein N-acetyltransferase
MALILETDRLYLRTWEPNDAERVFEICSDAQVMYHIGNRNPYQSLDEASRFIERAIGYQAENGFCRWAVVFKENRMIVGSCGLARLSGSGEIDLGYLFARDVWGKGLATEAAGACLRYGFEKLGFRQVIASTDLDHVASQRVLEKVGFAFRGIERRGDDDDKVFVANNPSALTPDNAGDLSAS